MINITAHFITRTTARKVAGLTPRHSGAVAALLSLSAMNRHDYFCARVLDPCQMHVSAARRASGGMSAVTYNV